jgi:hypothetical protein
MPSTAHKNTRLFVAAENGSLQWVQFLIEEEHLKVNTTDSENRTALYLACENGHDDLAKYLIENPEININFANVAGRTAFHEACSVCRLDTVNMLLEHGAQANEADEFDETPLTLAAGRYSEDEGLPIVRRLLQVPDIDVNAVNNKGRTALHEACYYGSRLDTVILLLEHGAKVNVSDSDGKTPLMIAAKRPRVLFLLVKAFVSERPTPLNTRGGKKRGHGFNDDK